MTKSGLTLRIASKWAPLRYAFTCAGLYCLIAVIWIRYTSTLAGATAESMEELERLEILKGLGFTISSSVLFFLFSISVFKRMAASARQLIQSQQQLVAMERDAITSLVMSSVAHDCANLLTILRLNTEKLKSLREMPQASVEVINKLDNGVSRLTELTSRLRTAGQNFMKDQPREFDLSETVAESVGFLRLHQAATACEYKYDQQKVEAVGYPILIHQLVMNLVINAAEATGSKCQIEIVARRQDGEILIEVNDNGPGVPEELRETIFNAFFTTKPHGTGLGLTSVKSCVELHDGRIQVGRSHFGGASFRVYLRDMNALRVAELQKAKAALDAGQGH